MLPSRHKKYQATHALENLDGDIISDASLSRHDTLTETEGLLIHAAPVLFEPEKQKIENYWRVEKMLDKETLKMLPKKLRDSFAREYCAKGFNDCGKSCPVANCRRNQ